jgi:RNA polymerase sigma-70 factor (ECF subfamily)
MQQDGGGKFPTTQWTLIARLKSDDAAVQHRALDDLCTQYHYPLYCCIRHRGLAHHDAQDALHDFLASLLRRGTFAKAERTEGHLRTFLSHALRQFLINWHRDRPHRACEISTDAEASLAETDARYMKERFRDDDTPERVFERKWAQELLHRVLQRLGEDCAARKKGALFAKLGPVLRRGGSLRGEDATALAADLGMTESALRMAHSRLLTEYAEKLRDEVRQTVTEESEVPEELAHLRTIFAS